VRAYCSEPERHQGGAVPEQPFDPGEDEEPEDEGQDAADELDVQGRRAVFVATAEPVSLTVAALADPRAPEGSALGSYIDGRLVARCAMPRGSIDRLMELGLLENPVPLGLVAFEAEPGLQCRLLALVPATDIEEEETADEPWRESVPSFEERMAAEEGDAGENPSFAAILLGNIVRFDRDRKHKDSLVQEAIDVLQRIVGGAGPLGDADARAIDDLLDSL
jgi:hypothetical protein